MPRPLPSIDALRDVAHEMATTRDYELVVLLGSLARRDKNPKDYFSSFVALGDAGIIPEPLAPAAGLRNRIVKAYETRMPRWCSGPRVMLPDSWNYTSARSTPFSSSKSRQGAERQEVAYA